MSVAVNSVSELKTLRVDEANGVIRWLVSRKAWYYPDLVSTIPNDDDNVIAPNLGQGRWIKQEAQQTNVLTDLLPTFETGAFTVQGGKRHFLDGSFTSLTLDITLPTTVTNGFSCEIIPYNVSLNKIIIFRGSGTVFVNGVQSDFMSNLQNGLTYKLYFANSTLGWFITLSDVNSRLNQITRASNLTIFTRQWNEALPYTYETGIYDLVGKAFNPSAAYNVNLTPDVWFQDMLTTSPVDSNPSIAITFSRARATSHMGRLALFSRSGRSEHSLPSTTNNWFSSTDGVVITNANRTPTPPIISINHSNQNPQQPTYRINPTGFFMMFGVGVDSNHNFDWADWQPPNILQSLANFRSTFQNIIFTGYEFDNFTNSVSYGLGDLIQRSSHQDLLFANKHSATASTLFDNDSIRVFASSQLPAPFNSSSRFIGIRYNILFNKNRYYDAFSLGFTSLSRTGTNNNSTPPSWFTGEWASGLAPALRYFEIFGNVYRVP